MSYIDAENIKYHKLSVCAGHGMNFEYTVAYKHEVDAIPTADVVPKSEVERLRKALDEYEETSGLKQAKKDIVSKILDELKEYIPPQKIGLFNSIYIADVIYELKKKYTGEKS